MAKLTIPPLDFDKELAPGQVGATMKAAGASPVMSGLFRVPFGALRELEDFNVRVDTSDYLSHVAELKASIKAEGYYADKPMAGYVAKEEGGNVIYITDGYTRYRALSELISEGVDGFDDSYAIPVIAKSAATNLEDLTVALVLGNEGRPLSVYERAVVAKRLLNMGVEEARIAERLSITARYLSDLLVLAGASAKVRNMVIQNKVSPTEAIKTLRKDGAKAGEKLEAGVKAATEAGKAKATAKDVKAATPPADLKEGVEAKVTTRKGFVKTEINYSFKQGSIVDFDQIKPVRSFNDADWWNFIDDTKKSVVIEETIAIQVIIATAEKDDTFDDGKQTGGDEPDTSGLHLTDETETDDDRDPDLDDEPGTGGTAATDAADETAEDDGGL